MTSLVCPTCLRRFEPRDSRGLPFCSPRCRLVDLGRWLNEQYALPVEGEGEEEDLESEPYPHDPD